MLLNWVFRRVFARRTQAALPLEADRASAMQLAMARLPLSSSTLLLDSLESRDEGEPELARRKVGRAFNAAPPSGQCHRLLSMALCLILMEPLEDHARQRSPVESGRAYLLLHVVLTVLTVVSLSCCALE